MIILDPAVRSERVDHNAGPLRCQANPAIRPLFGRNAAADRWFRGHSREFGFTSAHQKGSSFLAHSMSYYTALLDTVRLAVMLEPA